MRSPLVVAFLHPINLAALALAVVAGLCAAWWLFPVGLLAWLLMFLITYRDPALRFYQVLHSRLALAQRFQKPFDRIERAQIQIFNQINSTRRLVKRHLEPVLERVNKVADQAYQLRVRMTALQNYYLVTKANRDFDGELFVQQVKIDNAPDEVTRRGYEEAQKSLAEVRDNFRQIEVLLERVETQLLNVHSTLEQTMAETLRLQMLEPENIREQVPRLLQLLEDMAQQLAAFEQEEASLAR